MKPEPKIIINGTALTEGQAMTVRVALSAFIQETDNAIGDEMDRALNRGYAERSAEVFKLMLAPAQSPSQPLVEAREPEIRAWESEDGRVISAAQKATALRDGGASASSVKGYTKALFAAAPVRGLPLTTAQISGLARDAQIAYCLDKFSTFDEALTRSVEAHHGISCSAPGGDELRGGENV